MKKIYLHIGLEKTGTTAIQGFLNLNRNVLAKDYNILIPKLAEDTSTVKSNHRIAKLFVPNQKIAAHHTAINKARLNELLQNFQNNNHLHSLIISSELFGYSTEKEIVDLNKILSNFEVIVILFLRRQDDYLESLYDQYIKLTWINGTPAKSALIFCQSIKLNFYAFIMQWIENGFKNFDLKIYGISNERNFIFKQFFENINNSIINDKSLKFSNKLSNPALSLFHKILITQHIPRIEKMKLQKKIAFLIFKHNDSFGEFVNKKYDNSKRYYTRDFKTELLKKYTESNNKILQLFPNLGYSKEFLFNIEFNTYKEQTIEDISKTDIILFFFNMILFFIKDVDKKK